MARERARFVARLRRLLDEEELAIVDGLRGMNGNEWAGVAWAFETSRQAARQRYSGTRWERLRAEVSRRAARRTG